MIYKILLFDLDSTLWDFHSAENYALTKLLEKQDVEDVEAYIDVYVPMNRAMWRSLEKDEITREELVETRFAKLFDHFGFEKDGKELAADYEAILSTQGKRTKGRRRCFKRYRTQDMTYTLPQTASRRFKKGACQTRRLRNTSKKCSSRKRSEHKNRVKSSLNVSLVRFRTTTRTKQ